MIAFAAVCESVAGTASKREKIRLVGDYLATLDDADLAAAARYFTGNPFAARDQRSLALGGRTIVAAAQGMWGFTDAQLGVSYREHGDLGAALCPFVRPAPTLALFTETLTPALLKTILDEIAAAAGKAAGRKRQLSCERILGACTLGVEAKYVIKVMTGDLRIGLREGLVIDAIASAFGRPVREVRRATMAAGDIGAVAVSAKAGTLEGIAVSYGAPIAFMLASPVLYGSSYKELATAEWIVEDKFDGIRAQIHKDGRTVRIFSRTLNDVSHSYPEIVTAVRSLDVSVILDGEIIARRNGRVLPFRYLQARLQRKEVSAELLAEVPVAYACFDLLARNDEFLLDETLLERRAGLADIIAENEHLLLAKWGTVQSAAGADALHERFDGARAVGHEGLMLKRSDSPYLPGRRGKWWLKLKRELSTLDVVVVAVEWGHGKRAKVLSDYTFAVQDAGGKLLTIGKAYSGLTDAEIAQYTQWFLDHQTGKRGYALAVEPAVVIEVAFDIIQESTLHESGFALRFPRIVRIRDDKPANQIDTIERVQEIYDEMRAREGIAGPTTG